MRHQGYDQQRVDRLCQAVGWATANERTFTRLAYMSVDESGLGDSEGRPNKRFKIIGILRDALRQKSMGVIEEIPQRHRKVRQARRCNRLFDSGHECRPHGSRKWDIRFKVQGRDCLLSPSGKQKDDDGNGSPDARRSQKAGRAGRYLSMRGEAQHSPGAGTDVDLRPDHRHRRAGYGTAACSSGKPAFPAPTPYAGLPELYAARTMAGPPVAMVRSQIDISSCASGMLGFSTH